MLERSAKQVNHIKSMLLMCWFYMVFSIVKFCFKIIKLKKYTKHTYIEHKRCSIKVLKDKNYGVIKICLNSRASKNRQNK